MRFAFGDHFFATTETVCKIVASLVVVVVLVCAIDEVNVSTNHAVEKDHGSHGRPVAVSKSSSVDFHLVHRAIKVKRNERANSSVEALLRTIRRSLLYSATNTLTGRRARACGRKRRKTKRTRRRYERTREEDFVIGEK